MRRGTAGGFRDLAIFLIVFVVLMAFGSRVLSSAMALAWYAFVALASLFLIFRALRGGNTGPGGWGAVLPARVWRWMLGESEAESKSEREKSSETLEG